MEARYMSKRNKYYSTNSISQFQMCVD